MVSISASMWQACTVARTDTLLMQDMGDLMLRILSDRTCLKVLSRTLSLALTSRQPLVSSDFGAFAGISVDHPCTAVHNCSSVKNRLRLHYQSLSRVAIIRCACCTMLK